jgi:tetratricopeptide (TPR) repeat protein
MQKRKRESVMLNTLIKTHSSLALLIILIAISLSACSVAPLTSNTEGDSGLIESKHKVAFTQAVSAMKAGKLNKAQDLFINLINEQPNISNAHVNLGILFIKNKSLNEAENAFIQALKINPGNIYALNQLGILHRQQGNFSESKSAYEKAINIEPDYAFAHLNLGVLYDLYLYDFPKAIEQYKKYQELLPNKDKQVNKWIIDLERRYKKSLIKK